MTEETPATAQNEQLTKLLRSTGIPAPVFVPPEKKLRTFTELMNAKIPKMDYLVEDIIPKAGIIVCYGAPSSFKTNFMLYLTMMGSDGRDVLEFKVSKPFKILWIDEENRDIGMKDKIINIYNGICEGIARDGIVGFRDPNCLNGNLVTSTMEFNLVDTAKHTQLHALIQKHRPDLIVIDSVAKTFRLDEKDEKEVKKIYENLSPFVKTYGVSFVLIHHCRKKSREQTSIELEDLSGSREFGAMADSAFIVQKIGTNKYNVKQTKNRYGKPHKTITFEVFGKYKYIQLVFKGTTTNLIHKKHELLADQILAWAKTFNKTQFKKAEVESALEEFDYSEKNLKDALKLLLQLKCLKKGEKQGYYIVLKTEYKHRIIPTEDLPTQQELTVEEAVDDNTSVEGDCQ